MKLRLFKNILLLLIVQSSSTALCVGQKKLVGLWEGRIVSGVELRMVFNFSLDSGNNLKAIIEMPDHGSKFAGDTAILDGDDVSVNIKEANGRYRGVLVNDSTIKGNWIQGLAGKMTLNLKKIERIVKTVKKQTPAPPFNYKSEDIEYFNNDKSVKYAGTITIPPGKGPFPAAILITGSGQHNRDEEFSGHKPFAVIADHLTKEGFIILRVDDRGIGGTTGELKAATAADFAKDVMAGMDYLKKRSEVDVKKLGLIGHSEGGMIATMIAAERKDVDFIVLLAAPGIKITKLMVEQNEAILSTGFPKNFVQPYINLYGKMLQAINASNTSEETKTKISQLVQNWMDTTDKAMVMATTGIINEQKKTEFINTFSALSDNAWFKYFLLYDPAPSLEKLSCKVLALNGDKDIQVLSPSNLAGIREALKKSKVRISEVTEMPGLNHMFQNCKQCTVLEYAQLEETFSPEVLQKISEWLKKNVLNN